MFAIKIRPFALAVPSRCIYVLKVRGGRLIFDRRRSKIIPRPIRTNGGRRKCVDGFYFENQKSRTRGLWRPPQDQGGCQVRFPTSFRTICIGFFDAARQLRHVQPFIGIVSREENRKAIHVHYTPGAILYYITHTGHRRRRLLLQVVADQTDIMYYFFSRFLTRQSYLYIYIYIWQKHRIIPYTYTHTVCSCAGFILFFRHFDFA